MANTTLQCEFESVSGEDHAQVMRRWVVAETNVEAIDATVDVALARADDEILSSEFTVNALFRTSLFSQVY